MHKDFLKGKELISKGESKADKEKCTKGAAKKAQKER